MSEEMNRIILRLVVATGVATLPFDDPPGRSGRRVDMAPWRYPYNSIQKILVERRRMPPERRGIKRLSSKRRGERKSPEEKSSMRVVKIAPIMEIFKLKKKRETKKHRMKQERLPSRVLFRILTFPYFFPMIAAMESPMER